MINWHSNMYDGVAHRSMRKLYVDNAESEKKRTKLDLLAACVAIHLGVSKEQAAMFFLESQHATTEKLCAQSVESNCYKVKPDSSIIKYYKETVFKKDHITIFYGANTFKDRCCTTGGFPVFKY